jgi:hypothetical protein
MFFGAAEMRSHTPEFRERKLEAFRELSAQYTDTGSGHAALRRLPLLARMVEEDEAAAKQPRRSDKELSREELMEQWIFRLRDEPRTICRLYCETELVIPERGPAALLVARGYEAIPVLLKHLQDETPISTILSRGSSLTDAEHECSSVGHLAKVMLMAIIGSNLGCNVQQQGYDSTFEKRARSWLEQFQKNGEMVMLCRGLQASHYSSLILARRLAERYPDFAEEPLRRALSGTRDPHVRLELLKLLVGLLDRNEQQRQKKAGTPHVGDITADPAARLLMNEAQVPCFETWQFAAAELRRRHQPLGVLAVKLDDVPDDLKELGNCFFIRSLAKSNNPAALKLLAGWMRTEHFSSSVQSQLIETIGDERLKLGEQLKPEVSSAMDDILITALDLRICLTLGAGNGQKTSTWSLRGQAARYLAQIHLPHECVNFDDPAELDRLIDRLKANLRDKDASK